jgi:YD repeat-containing protein
VDRDIEPNTGLTKVSRDEAGLATTYVYDARGRTTSVQPAQDSWTQIIYTPASSPASLAQAYVARQGNGGSGIVAESKTLFDALKSVLDAVKNRLRVVISEERRSVKYVGRNAGVVLDTFGKVITA